MKTKIVPLKPEKPRMYDYFLEKKGIELEFDEIRHWVDKKVVKGFRRVFFVNTFRHPAECIIRGKGFVLDMFYAKCELKNVSYFYVDIPVNRHIAITKYEIIVHREGKEIWHKTIKPSGDFEDLT